MTRADQEYHQGIMRAALTVAAEKMAQVDALQRRIDDLEEKERFTSHILETIVGQHPEWFPID